MPRPLRPKPASLQDPKLPDPTLLKQSKRRARTCRVAICPAKHCNLRTHQHYSTPDPGDGSIERPIHNEAGALHLVDAFEKDMFRHCMDTVLKKKLFVYGLAYPALNNIMALKNSIIQLAMLRPCEKLILLASSFCDVFVRRPSPDQELEGVYQKTRSAMQGNDNLENVAMLVVIQSTLDQYRGRDLRPHHRLLKSITDGRFHLLTKSLHYIIEADRRIAVWTKSLPALQASMPTEMTGYQYIEEARALIQLFEREGYEFDAEQIPMISPFHYHKRDALADAFTRIHAVATGKEWCAAVAARIIEYQISRDGEITACMVLMIDFLTDALKRKVREVDWSDDQDMLIWIYFVVEDSWSIRKHLQSQYGSTVPPDWSQKQWILMTEKYAWAQRMKRKHDGICEAVLGINHILL